MALSKPRWNAVFAALLGLSCFVGCGPKSDRLEVGGRVTLDGEPLSGGMIRFSSTGEKLASAGANIEAGEYFIPQEKGLPPGSYRLEINAPDNDAKPVVSRPDPNGPAYRGQPERIPAEYNASSTRTVDVSVDGENRFDFEIVSRPAR